MRFSSNKTSQCANDLDNHILWEQCCSFFYAIESQAEHMPYSMQKDSGLHLWTRCIINSGPFTIEVSWFGQ